MNASGEKWRAEIDGTAYYFDSFSMECISKIADTPLIGGGVYRRRTLPAIYELTFGMRVGHSALESCRALMSARAATSCTIRIGQTVFSDCMLRRGGFKAADGKEKAMFEIRFTGVCV